jgi:hypothetical protein
MSNFVKVKSQKKSAILHKMLYIAPFLTEGIRRTDKGFKFRDAGIQEAYYLSFMVRQIRFIEPKIHISNTKILNNGKRRSDLLPEIRTGTLG